MSVLNIGIAGYGVVGKRRHLSLKKIKNVKLIAICDKNYKKNHVAKNGLKIFSHYSDLIKQDIQILIVCLTNDVAAQVTIEALKKKIHVFCEKPPGRNLQDIKMVIKQFEKKPNIKLMYGFNHRYHYSISKTKKIIDSKKYGNIINLRGVYGKSKIVTFNQTDWRTKRSIAGGGILLDQGIHLIDLIRYFAGNFEQVKSFISNDYWKFDVEDNAFAILKTNKNIYATIHSSATQWKHLFNLEINLEKAIIILSGIISSSKSYGQEKIIIIKKNKLGKKNDHIIEKFNKDNSWDIEISNFIDAVVKKRKIINGSCYEALETMKLVFRIYYEDKLWRKKYDIPKPN